MSKHQLKTNVIYCGDNLQMLKEIPDESIDLIYIDPPFNSNRNYETFWHDTQETRAFEDRFGNVQHYIEYIRPRVIEMHRVLKQTGSFYYHCDWHASHYIKILLDQIFDINNFVNEIVWYYPNKIPDKRKKLFTQSSDRILFYAKHRGEHIFNVQEEKRDRPITVTKIKKVDGKKIYMRGDDGKVITFTRNTRVVDDVWKIAMLMGQKERLGYPTQKPLTLLERIINASSNKEDIILDAFCGCGTTLVAAQKLGRKWVGIDISPTACRVMAQRLWDDFKLNEDKDFELLAMPTTEEDLMKLPPFEFQNWAVIALGGIPNQVKVGDYGIDGKLYPIEQEKVKDEGKNLFGDIDIYYPIQVKQKDKAGRPDIDSFETAMRRDKRRKGYFVSFGFTEDAVKEIKRLDKEGELEILPVTVSDILKQESQALQP